MDHGITRRASGANAVVPILEAEYADLAAANYGLLEALFLEEKFDLVVENFLELETELLNSTARYVVHGETSYGWFQDERNLINRRLVNLLTVCRGYLDFARPLAQRLLTGESEKASKFDDCFGNHYDTNFGYRVMEAMRNYVQHRGFPIHALEYTGNRHEAEPRNLLSYGVSVFTKTTYLRSDGGFKASVLAELEALGGRVDVKPLFRDYVGCIAAIHEELRTIQRSSTAIWEAKFADAATRFKTAFPTEPSMLGLVATKIDGSSRTDEISLYPGFIERRRELESKNQRYRNFAKRYVTGSVRNANA